LGATPGAWFAEARGRRGGEIRPILRRGESRREAEAQEGIDAAADVNADAEADGLSGSLRP